MAESKLEATVNSSGTQLAKGVGAGAASTALLSYAYGGLQYAFYAMGGWLPAAIIATTALATKYLWLIKNGNGRIILRWRHGKTGRYEGIQEKAQR